MLRQVLIAATLMLVGTALLSEASAGGVYYCGGTIDGKCQRTVIVESSLIPGEDHCIALWYNVC
jgi:hypothetical protein